MSADAVSCLLPGLSLSPLEYHASPQLSDVHELTGLNAAREAYGLTGEGQTVVVIDSGIAYDHEALGAGFGESYRVVGGWDFTGENDADPYDDGPAGAHGTHVAGIIASDDENYSGVAPGVDLVALRVFDDAGSGYFAWVEQALDWVHDHRFDFENPITTVNLSIGSDWNDDTVPQWATLEDEFAELAADGIFISVGGRKQLRFVQHDGTQLPGGQPARRAGRFDGRRRPAQLFHSARRSRAGRTGATHHEHRARLLGQLERQRRRLRDLFRNQHGGAVCRRGQRAGARSAGDRGKQCRDPKRHLRRAARHGRFHLRLRYGDDLRPQ